MTDLAEKIARVIDPVAWLNEVMRPFDWEARQKVSTDKASAILALLEPEGWQPIDTAPKDGTKIDLLYPYPRGRTINCFWDDSPVIGGAWIWLTPIWKDGNLLPESEWSNNCYPNMDPTHWRPVSPLPSPNIGGKE